MDHANIAREPEAHGFTWLVEDVSKRFGPNDSDKHVVGQLPIFTPRDLGKLRKTFGDETVLGWVTSASSPRVKSQNKYRPQLANGNAPTMDDMKANIVRAMAGVRVAAARGQTFTFIGADGTEFTVHASDKDEAKAAYARYLEDDENDGYGEDPPIEE